jgi:hypothetical protein
MLILHTRNRVYKVPDAPKEHKDAFAGHLLKKGKQSVPWLARETVEGEELVKVGDIYLVRRAPHGLVAGFHIDELLDFSEE